MELLIILLVTAVFLATYKKKPHKSEDGYDLNL